MTVTSARYSGASGETDDGNRIRFLVETTHAVAEEIGADRTAVRLSPNGAIMGVDDSGQDALFTAAARALSPLGLAFLELRDIGSGDGPAMDA